MIENNKNESCCPSLHAKIIEIILIIGFTLSLVSLTVNLIILLWCIKRSYPLLIIGIRLIALNTISLVLSIILRAWRSNGSVFNTKFLSSYCLAIINFVLVIINLLSSITEEVLFSYVISIFSLYYSDDEDNHAILVIMEMLDIYTENEIVNIYGSFTNNFEEKLKEAKNYYKKEKIFEDIMKKNFHEDLFEGLSPDEILKKVKVLKILPWITINFNILIQVIMLIFIIILILKISAKSDSGSQHLESNLSVKDKILVYSNNLNQNGAESKELKEKKEKKKKKRRKKKAV